MWNSLVVLRYECVQGHEIWLNEETEDVCPICESTLVRCIEWGTPPCEHFKENRIDCAHFDIKDTPVGTSRYCKHFEQDVYYLDDKNCFHRGTYVGEVRSLRWSMINGGEMFDR